MLVPEIDGHVRPDKILVLKALLLVLHDESAHLKSFLFQEQFFERAVDPIGVDPFLCFRRFGQGPVLIPHQDVHHCSTSTHFFSREDLTQASTKARCLKPSRRSA